MPSTAWKIYFAIVHYAGCESTFFIYFGCHTTRRQKAKGFQMFRWTDEARERAIDLACVPSLTIDDVAECVGASLSGVKKFYAANRSEIEAARLSVQVSDGKHAEILAMLEESSPREEISERTGLSADVVRRLILAEEYDEAPVDQGAALELHALQMAHPDKFYTDDIRALTEFGNGRLPVRMSAPDAGLRAAA
jgi:hypothetical protein